MVQLFDFQYFHSLAYLHTWHYLTITNMQEIHRNTKLLSTCHFAWTSPTIWRVVGESSYIYTIIYILQYVIKLYTELHIIYNIHIYLYIHILYILCIIIYNYIYTYACVCVWMMMRRYHTLPSVCGTAVEDRPFGVADAGGLWRHEPLREE